MVTWRRRATRIAVPANAMTKRTHACEPRGRRGVTRPDGTLIVRLTDTALAFPASLAGIAIVAVLGPGSRNVTYAIAFATGPVFIRLARATVLSERPKDYVRAAEALGARPGRVLFRHIL